RLQPVMNVETEMTTVNRPKSVANTRPRYASGTLNWSSVELNTHRTFAALVARNRAAAASHRLGIEANVRRKLAEMKKARLIIRPIPAGVSPTKRRATR